MFADTRRRHSRRDFRQSEGLPGQALSLIIAQKLTAYVVLISALPRPSIAILFMRACTLTFTTPPSVPCCSLVRRIASCEPLLQQQSIDRLIDQPLVVRCHRSVRLSRVSY